MSAGYEVLEFEHDHANRVFSDSHDIYDAARAPVGPVSPRGDFASARPLFERWRRRAIPANREGIDRKLSELGLASPEQVASVRARLF